jgi:hypothetical protein
VSGWSGDISKMGQLAANIRKLAAVPARAAPRVSKEIAKLVDLEFQAGADPYGNAWKPHAQSTIERWGSHPLLDLSGDMRASVHVSPLAGSGVAITIDHPSEDHQTGWSGSQGSGPARPVLPSGTFPAMWREAIKIVVDDEIRGAA